MSLYTDCKYKILTFRTPQTVFNIVDQYFVLRPTGWSLLYIVHIFKRDKALKPHLIIDILPVIERGLVVMHGESMIAFLLKQAAHAFNRFFIHRRLVWILSCSKIRRSDACQNLEFRICGTCTECRHRQISGREFFFQSCKIRNRIFRKRQSLHNLRIKERF